MNKKYLETWNKYVALEKEVEEVIKYIPLSDDHFKVWSMKIGDLLIVLGSDIDSFLKLAIKDEELDGVENINTIRDKYSPTILDYKETFAKYYEIFPKYIFVRPTEKRIQPFNDWSLKKEPSWWRAIQQIKHNRYENKEMAELGCLINGLAGLFLLNVIHLSSRLILCRLKLWKSYKMREYSPQNLESMIIVKEPLNQREFEIFYIETNLFGYILEDNRNEETTDENKWNEVLNLLTEPRY